MILLVSLTCDAEWQEDLYSSAGSTISSAGENPTEDNPGLKVSGVNLVSVHDVGLDSEATVVRLSTE